MKRIGIYAGTFDPVHMGHVSFGLATRRKLQLDTVVYLPEPSPRYKTNVTNLEHRLAMLQLTLAPYPELTSLTLESPQFTITETLPELETQFPESELTFLIGSDVIPSLHLWPNIEKLLQTTTLAIGLREGTARRELENQLEQLESKTSTAIRRHYITTPHSGARSSDIRAGLRPIYTSSAARYAARANLYGHKK